MQTDFGIANGADILTPSANPDGSWPLDMTGYNDIQIAIRPTNGGNFAIAAVMGPDSNSYANLNPVNAAATLKGTGDPNQSTMKDLFVDSAESLTADVWNIFLIGGPIKESKTITI